MGCKIVLVGYMGSGKSTVAKGLGEQLGFPVFDLDDLIEKKVGKSIAEIFTEHGEIYFRKLEHEVFVKQMEVGQNFILSLGGGTPCYANNHLMLKGVGVLSVYLRASVVTLVERLSKEKEHRPLIATLSEEEMTEFVAKHLFDRNYYYNQCNEIISVDHKTLGEVVDELVGLYSKYA